MFINLSKKIASNLKIYKSDIKSKGMSWFFIYRLYKRLPIARFILTPILNLLKPDFVIVEGNKMYIDKSDATVSQELILSGKWEAYETELFKKYVKKNDTVIDVGAHIGYYTLIAARIVGNKGKVYAFEPDPNNFKILKRNVTQNGYKNVELINKALSDKAGNIQLFLNKENTGDHRIYDSLDKREFINIKAISLDDYLKKIKRVDFIKMDIQGSEVNAFKGARRIIRENKDIKILTEFWPQGLELNRTSAREYVELLKENEFNIQDVDENSKTIKLVTADDLLKSFESDSKTHKNLLCIRKK